MYFLSKKVIFNCYCSLPEVDFWSFPSKLCRCSTLPAEQFRLFLFGGIWPFSHAGYIDPAFLHRLANDFACTGKGIHLDFQGKDQNTNEPFVIKNPMGLVIYKTAYSWFIYHSSHDKMQIVDVPKFVLVQWNHLNIINIGSTWITNFDTFQVPPNRASGPPETFTRRIRACAQKGVGGWEPWGICPMRKGLPRKATKKTKEPFPKP